MKLIVFSFIMLTTLSNCLSQDVRSNKVYSKVELREDLEVFRGILEELHSGLYWYRSREETNKHLEDIRSSLHDETSEIEFYKRLAPFINRIGCGHTVIGLSDSLDNEITDEGKFFPLYLKFLDSQAYCLQNNSNDRQAIQPGSKILTINGHDMDSLISRFTEFAVGDGYIQSVKLRALDYDFEYYYRVIMGEFRKFTIEFVDVLGNKGTAELDALSKSEIQENAKRYVQSKPVQENIQLTFLPQSNSALLRIKIFFDWNAGKQKFKFEKVISQCFQKIDSSGVNNLIVDVRNNPGGRDNYGLELFSYLFNKSIIEFKRIEFKTKESKFLDYSERKKLYFNKHKKINDSTFIETKGKTLQSYGPSSPQFGGNVFLLMNGNCFSTCADFTALVKSYDIATIIGEEPGGGYYGNTSGSVIPFTLPNTKMRLWVPTNRYTTNVSPIVEFGRGTPPDYPLTPLIEDLAKGVDTELEFTLRLIHKDK
ncbi:MAG: S41 family peptidase [Cyclobacteriaceae bacterium]